MLGPGPVKHFQSCLARYTRPHTGGTSFDSSSMGQATGTQMSIEMYHLQLQAGPSCDAYVRVGLRMANCRRHGRTRR